MPFYWRMKCSCWILFSRIQCLVLIPVGWSYIPLSAQNLKPSLTSDQKQRLSGLSGFVHFLYECFNLHTGTLDPLLHSTSPTFVFNFDIRNFIAFCMLKSLALQTYNHTIFIGLEWTYTVDFSFFCFHFFILADSRFIVVRLRRLLAYAILSWIGLRS